MDNRQRPPTVAPRPIQIELPADLEATYANFALITHSPSEMIIDFARVLPNQPKAKIYTRIVMTPMNAKLVVAPNATSAKFVALDKRFAIRESVAQPLMIEAEKVISQKLESAVISKESVYTIMVDDAIKASDYSS